MCISPQKIEKSFKDGKNYVFFFTKAYVITMIKSDNFTKILLVFIC